MNKSVLIAGAVGCVLVGAFGLAVVESVFQPTIPTPAALAGVGIFPENQDATKQQLLERINVLERDLQIALETKVHALRPDAALDPQQDVVSLSAPDLPPRKNYLAHTNFIERFDSADLDSSTTFDDPRQQIMASSDVYSAVQADEFYGLAVTNVECRGSICKIEAQYGDQLQLEQLISKLVPQLAWAGASESRVKPVAGGFLAELFVERVNP